MPEGFYINIDTIKNASVVIGLLGSVVAFAWKLFSWVNHQKEQDAKLEALEQKEAADIKELRELHAKEVKELRDHHEEDMKKLRNETNDVVKSIQEEQTIIVYGLLASLKGQHEQGCNGPVTEAIDKLEKHINQKAHGQCCFLLGDNPNKPILQ